MNRDIKTDLTAPNGRAPLTHEAYLAQLGERVRTWRARRGMSRKILAQSSGVSERYLAQLESGKGNISVGLLRQVAEAMSLPIEDLVREGPEMPPAYSLLLRHINGLTEEELENLYRTILASTTPAGNRERRIALIGLRGAGKSTLGGALSRKLGVPFIELVQEIEREAGMSVNEIFSLSGQATYRRLEKKCLEHALERFNNVIIAIGGSLVSEPSTYELLLASCYTVWLKAAPEEHMDRVIAQGDYRPMADNDQAMEDLRRILTEREDLYSRADTTLDTSGKSIQQSLASLLDLKPLRTILLDSSSNVQYSA